VVIDHVFTFSISFAGCIEGRRCGAANEHFFFVFFVFFVFCGPAIVVGVEASEKEQGKRGNKEMALDCAVVVVVVVVVVFFGGFNVCRVQ
jgi:hypothetical protein